MKLERLPEYATAVITIGIGMLLAVYIGISTGTGSKTPMFIIGGGVAMGLALILKKNIWLLIPICSFLQARTLGTSFGAHQMAIAYAFCVFLTLRALKIVRGKPVYDWLDYILFLNLAYLAVTYLRNPVGTNTFGFEKIGGRPYVEVIFALLAYYVLSLVKMSSRLALWMPFLMTIGNIINSIAGAIGAIFPSVGMRLYPIYGAFCPPQNVIMEDTGGGDGISREGYLVAGSNGILQALCSYFPPSSLLNPFRVFRFTVTLLALIGLLKTGFRSALFGSFIFALTVTYFRNGLASILRILFLLVPLVVIMALGQGTLFSLPLNMQRTLSFLPGHWDSAAIENAKGSTEWRHEIWSNVWNSGHKYINNWWLGDGFGITRNQLRENNQSSDSQENLTINGAYHSLPLSTIHVVGYVGLVLLIIQFIAQMYYAWSLVKRAKGTPFFAMALFSAAPCIYTPITGMLLFGAFDLAAPGNIFTVAWLRLISRSLEAYLEEKRPSSSKQPAPMPDFDLAPQFQRPLLKNPL